MANTEKLGDPKDKTSVEGAKMHAKTDKLGEIKTDAKAGFFAKCVAYYREHEKMFNGIGIGILVVAAVLVVYFLWLSPKWNNEASSKAQATIQSVTAGDMMRGVPAGVMTEDTVALKAALEGNDTTDGLVKLIEDYDHFVVKSATAAKSGLKNYAALCYLKIGQADEALDMLLKMKKRDDYMWYEAQMLIGDIYDDQNDVDNAKKYYEKAVKGETHFVAPIALWKLGMLAERKGDYAAAYDYYSQIKEDYYDRYQEMGVDKYYERAKIKAGK